MKSDARKRLEKAVANSRLDAVAFTVMSVITFVIMVAVATTVYSLEPLYLSTPVVFALGGVQGCSIMYTVVKWGEFIKLNKWFNNKKEDIQ